MQNFWNRLRKKPQRSTVADTPSSSSGAWRAVDPAACPLQSDAAAFIGVRRRDEDAPALGRHAGLSSSSLLSHDDATDATSDAFLACCRETVRRARCAYTDAALDADTGVPRDDALMPPPLVESATADEVTLTPTPQMVRWWAEGLWILGVSRALRRLPGYVETYYNRVPFAHVPYFARRASARRSVVQQARMQRSSRRPAPKPRSSDPDRSGSAGDAGVSRLAASLKRSEVSRLLVLSLVTRALLRTQALSTPQSADTRQGPSTPTLPVVSTPRVLSLANEFVSRQSLDDQRVWDPCAASPTADLSCSAANKALVEQLVVSGDISEEGVDAALERLLVDAPCVRQVAEWRASGDQTVRRRFGEATYRTLDAMHRFRLEMIAERVALSSAAGEDERRFEPQSTAVVNATDGVYDEQQPYLGPNSRWTADFLRASEAQQAQPRRTTITQRLVHVASPFVSGSLMSLGPSQEPHALSRAGFVGRDLAWRSAATVFAAGSGRVDEAEPSGGSSTAVGPTSHLAQLARAYDSVFPLPPENLRATQTTAGEIGSFEQEAIDYRPHEAVIREYCRQSSRAARRRGPLQHTARRGNPSCSLTEKHRVTDAAVGQSQVDSDPMPVSASSDVRAPTASSEPSDVIDWTHEHATLLSRLRKINPHPCHSARELARTASLFQVSPRAFYTWERIGLRWQQYSRDSLGSQPSAGVVEQEEGVRYFDSRTSSKSNQRDDISADGAGLSSMLPLIPVVCRQLSHEYTLMLREVDHQGFLGALMLQSELIAQSQREAQRRVALFEGEYERLQRLFREQALSPR